MSVEPEARSEALSSARASSRVRLTDMGTLRGVVKNVFDNDLSFAASAMAFDIFLGLLPLMALMGFIAGVLHRSGAKYGFDLRLLDYAPGPAAQVAREQFERLASQGSTIAPIAVIGFLWLASDSAHVAIATVRKIYGVPRRKYFRTRLLGLVLTFIGVIVALISSASVVVVHRLGVTGVFSANEADVWKWIIGIVSFLFLATGIAVLYRVAIGSRYRGGPLIPGALIAAVGFVLCSYAFSVYVRYVARFAAFYGGLAAVAIFLFWLWLVSLTVLLGAEVNAYLTPLEERPRAKGAVHSDA